MNSSERERFIQSTIASVLKAHAVRREVFFGYSKAHYVVDARVDAAKRMKAAGLRHTQIASALNKSRRTIIHYMHHSGQRVKNNPFVSVPFCRPTLSALESMAGARGVSKAALVALWVSERISAETKVTA